MTSPTQPTHNFLITIPRTASNLLTRLLNLPAQPSLLRHDRDGYFFLPALGYRYGHDTFHRPIEDWTDEEQIGMSNALQHSFQVWEGWISHADQVGKGTFVKEHINWMVRAEEESIFIHKSMHQRITRALNPTSIPDAFLLHRTRATFLIRHPAITFPSLVRTVIDNEGIEVLLKDTTERTLRWEATYYWHRALYEYMVASPQYPCPSHKPDVQYPIIIDASDLSNPELVRKYASVIGLSAQEVKFEWNPANNQEQESIGKMEARMKDTLLRSNGVIAEKLQDSSVLNVEQECKKWVEEFGEVLGKTIKLLVQDAMEDYEWLWRKRITMNHLNLWSLTSI